MAQDLRFAARSLLRSPRFSLVALLTLALGIGATTAIFTVVNAALLAPLPYHDPARRVMIWSRWTGFDKTWVSDAEIYDYRQRCRTITSVAAWDTAEANITGDGPPVHVAIGRVTANTFDVLGAVPIAGRSISEDEDRPNGSHVAVLSYGFWQRRYAGDPGVVGRTIDIDAVPYQVVGIMGRGFQLPTDFSQEAATPTELWRPLGLDPAHLERGSHNYFAAGALAPGATPSQATAELGAIATALTADGEYPQPMHFGAFAVPVDEEVRGAVRPAIRLVVAAVVFLLLIACANVANLLFVRGDVRRRELAIRTSLGASASRLLRSLILESLLLSAAGALCGLAFAKAGLAVLLAVDPTSLPALAPVTIDLRVLAFTALAVIATTVLCGTAPAMYAVRLGLGEALREGGQQGTVGSSRQRTRAFLVASEMTMAVVLVIGAGLMLRSLDRLRQVPLGFQPAGVLVARVSVPAAAYDSAGKAAAFYGALQDRVRALPQVQAAGLVRSLPLENTIGDWGLVVDGYVPPPGTHAQGDWQVVSPGALAALGERIVAGRDILSGDVETTQQIALINETMARIYWPGRDPVGGRFKMGAANPTRPWVTVVGVVADVRHNGVTGQTKAKFYRPLAQFTSGLGGGFVLRTFALVIRTSGDPTMLATPVREVLRGLDPNVPLSNVETMTDVVDTALATPRLAGFLLGTFAALALILAAVGVYGVLSFIVSQRQHEIAIRLAIGAEPRAIARMVLGRGLMLSAAGVGAGVAAAGVLSRVMQGLLYGVTPLDAATFTAVPVLLMAVSALASYLPARRAVRIDPIVALRAG